MVFIYDSNKVKVGALPLIYNEHIDKDINGNLSFSFSYPNTDTNYQYIKEENYIICYGNEYVIKERNITRDCVDAVALVNLEAFNSVIDGLFLIETRTVYDAFNLAIAGTGWTIVGSGITKKRSIRKKNSRIINILKDLIKLYNIEVKYNALEKKIYISEQIGEDKGCYFAQNINLINLDIQSDSYDFFTKIIAKGKDGLTFASINSNKDYLTNNSFSAKNVEYYWEDNRYTDKQSLKDDAQAKLNEACKPMFAYKVNIIDLANASNNSVFQYDIGDIITLVLYDGTKVKQRIVKMSYYPSTPENSTCEISNRLRNLLDMNAKFEQIGDVVDEVVTSDNMISTDKLQGTITPSDGTVTGDKIADATITSAKIGNLEVKTANIDNLAVNNAKIANASITSAKIGNLEVKNANIDNASITEAKIGNAAITNAKIGNLAVTRAKIADASIGNAQIENATITRAKLELAIIGSAQIEDLQVNTAKIANAAITSAKIGNLQVDTTHIAQAAIVEAKIGNLAVTNAKIANLSVDTAKIKDLSVTSAKIANLAVGSAQINDASIITAKIDDLAVNTAKIGNAAITSAKIGGLEVKNANIDNAAITSAKIGNLEVKTANIDNAAITSGKIANLQVGTGHIVDLSITTGKIGDLQVTNAKISNLAVDTAKIKDASIVNAKIANLAVTTAKIANLAVTNAQIADATILSAKIADAQITSAKIKDLSVTNAKINDLNASKINTGKLNTGLVQVGSASGNLLISDNTITIKDAQATPKTRVQVGKDAQGNYGIIVQNALGKAIFDSAQGILDPDGLASGVVSNDKIKDTSVTTNKLNVDEIFANNAFIGKLKAVEISATQITTGKISNDLINLEGLISFSTLDTSMKDCFLYPAGSNKTFINGGAIFAESVTADKINIKGLNVTDNTNTTTFSISPTGDVHVTGEIKSDNFLTGISGYSLTRDGNVELNDATIRGDVLLYDSGITSYGSQRGNENLAKGTSVAKEATGNNTVNHTLDIYPLDGTKIDGKQITVSFKYRMNATAGTFYLQTNGTYWAPLSKYINFGNTTDESVFTTTIKIPSGKVINNINLRMDNFVGTVKIFDLKVEYGDVKTPWKPANGEGLDFIRFWAGASYEDREKAPFKVYSDGSINASKGYFGGTWTGQIKIANIEIADTTNSVGYIVIRDNTDTKEIVRIAEDKLNIRTDMYLGKDGVDGLIYHSSNNFIETTNNLYLNLNCQYGSLTVNDKINGSLLTLKGNNGSVQSIDVVPNTGTLRFTADNTERDYDFIFARASSNLPANVFIKGKLDVDKGIVIGKMSMVPTASGMAFIM